MSLTMLISSLARSAQYWRFLPELENPADQAIDAVRQISPSQYRHPAGVALATVVACLLHGSLLFWYMARPAPLPISSAAPLPMISMELSAPPSPVVAPPQPEPPKEVVKPQPKPVKPKVKHNPKPKPKPAEAAVNPVETAKEEPESTAQPAGGAPLSSNQSTLGAPRNDTFVQADSNAAYLNNPAPKYPLRARQRHWEGRVLLRVYVSADGQAQQVVLQASSGHDILDESALEAVRKWRFVPAKRGDSPEASWVTIPIVFRLE